MKPLQKIYLGERITRDSYMWPINTLINKIEKENNLFDFRDQLSAIVQLYFDGLIKKEHSGTKEKNKVWSEQKLVLDKLNNAGKLAYGSFKCKICLDFRLY